MRKSEENIKNNNAIKRLRNWKKPVLTELDATKTQEGTHPDIVESRNVAGFHGSFG